MNNQVDDAIEHTVEDFDDLHVVVFVQDATTLEILQSAGPWISSMWARGSLRIGVFTER